MFQALSSIQTMLKLNDKANGIFLYTSTDLKLVNMNAIIDEVYAKSK
jgi:hypothetical protein